MDSLQKKHDALKRIIKSYGSVLVAYSGGVDSTLLLKVAADTLGAKVLAVTARSETYSHDELKLAKKISGILGVRHRVIESGELSNEHFARNPPDRCYWCKRELLARLKNIARREAIRHVAVASQSDDLSDYRPGERAVREMGAVSPLREARFTKSDIRRLSKRLGLPGWQREAMACLASRFPYGDRINGKKLAMVETSEAFLRRKGFRNVRVRCAGDGARIEVDETQLGRLSRRRLRHDMVRELKRLGFLFVSLDLEGYRMGSLNASLRRGETGAPTTVTREKGKG